ncbi:MAG: hypothetical protein AAGG99_10000, partial [Pseudomonadota bacterium]
ADDPRSLQRCAANKPDTLPFLAAALARHVEEYPAAATGLTRTEAQILSLVADGVTNPVDVFRQNMGLETALFMGDAPTFTHIARLCNATPPLLACTSPPFRYPPAHAINRDALRAQRLAITEAGQDVLDGHRSAIDMIDRDQWLGGVHLKSDADLWVRNDRGDLIRQAA